MIKSNIVDKKIVPNKKPCIIFFNRDMCHHSRAVIEKGLWNQLTSDKELYSRFDFLMLTFEWRSNVKRVEIYRDFFNYTPCFMIEGEQKEKMIVYVLPADIRRTFDTMKSWFLTNDFDFTPWGHFTIQKFHKFPRQTKLEIKTFLLCCSTHLEIRSYLSKDVRMIIIQYIATNNPIINLR